MISSKRYRVFVWTRHGFINQLPDGFMSLEEAKEAVKMIEDANFWGDLDNKIFARIYPGRND